LAAAEIIESDLWLQYQELGGVQDNEVSKLASKLIPGYPAQPIWLKTRMRPGAIVDRRWLQGCLAGALCSGTLGAQRA
jgi:hypothetical protein